ncbi:MAG: ribosome biogenesis GTP-binding protein YihA/YsxC [Eubacteriales bacterium]|nr:ribosome biogenesis GTP-binding protein YihA/YsxC [Eubacteriales bacterium]
MAKYFQNPAFVKSAFRLQDCLPEDRPELLLSGRSNVGKSTLINQLCQRKSLARVASTPGKTQSINYYDIDSRFYLTDLPGYGYTRTGERTRQQFSKLIESYFQTRSNIVLVLALIDLRHPPTQQDEQMLDFLLSRNIPFRVVLTKADKLKPNARREALRSFEAFAADFGIEPEQAYFYNSSFKPGAWEPLRLEIERLIDLEVD